MSQKPQRGRPITKPLPERINASPETIAEVVLRAKPQKVWDYMKKQEITIGSLVYTSM